MTLDLIPAEPPWHWWLGAFSLVSNLTLVIGLGVAYYRMVVAPTRPPRRSDAPPRHDGGGQPIGRGDSS